MRESVFPHPRVDRLDRCVTLWMHHWGHRLHRYGLALVFIWLGLLKVFGYKSATSIVAETVYFGDPQVTVIWLGAWEVAIGLMLLWTPLVRLSMLLLAIRLPGTLLALLLKYDVCFDDSVLTPTIQGQYLIKDIVLITAAMVIGGTVRDETPPRRLLRLLVPGMAPTGNRTGSGPGAR
jgi:uncharacterized membrane protein YkgB